MTTIPKLKTSEPLPLNEGYGELAKLLNISTDEVENQIKSRIWRIDDWTPTHLSISLKPKRGGKVFELRCNFWRFCGNYFLIFKKLFKVFYGGKIKIVSI